MRISRAFQTDTHNQQYEALVHPQTVYKPLALRPKHPRYFPTGDNSIHTPKFVADLARGLADSA